MDGANFLSKETIKLQTILLLCTNLGFIHFFKPESTAFIWQRRRKIPPIKWVHGVNTYFLEYAAGIHLDFTEFLEFLNTARRAGVFRFSWFVLHDLPTDTKCWREFTDSFYVTGCLYQSRIHIYAVKISDSYPVAISESGGKGEKIGPYWSAHGIMGKGEAPARLSRIQFSLSFHQTHK